MVHKIWIELKKNELNWNWIERFWIRFELELNWIEKSWIQLELELNWIERNELIRALLGDWLSGSGWTTLLDKACVATSGSAQSFLAASHITRTRYAHQVTSLFYLLQLAFGSYLEQHDDTTPPLTRNEWIEQQCKLQPQFSYWHQTLKLQLTAFAVSVICAITIYPPKFETIHFFILSIHHCG